MKKSKKKYEFGAYFKYADLYEKLIKLINEISIDRIGKNGIYFEEETNNSNNNIFQNNFSFNKSLNSPKNNFSSFKLQSYLNKSNNSFLSSFKNNNNNNKQYKLKHLKKYKLFPFIYSPKPQNNYFTSKINNYDNIYNCSNTKYSNSSIFNNNSSRSIYPSIDKNKSNKNIIFNRNYFNNKSKIIYIKKNFSPNNSINKKDNSWILNNKKYFSNFFYDEKKEKLKFERKKLLNSKNNSLTHRSEKKIIYKNDNNKNNYDSINIDRSFKIKEKLTLKKIKLNNLKIFTKNIN